MAPIIIEKKSVTVRSIGSLEKPYTSADRVIISKVVKTHIEKNPNSVPPIIPPTPIMAPSLRNIFLI